MRKLYLQKIVLGASVALFAGMAYQALSPVAWMVEQAPQLSLALTPWEAVGGCGAGGSGGGAGDGIQWVGEGVSGGRVELEVLPRYSVGQNYTDLSIPLRWSFKPTWNMNLGLTLPLVSKRGEVQYRTNQSPADRTTGGLGDIAVDWSFNLGPSAQYSFSLAQTLPTGQYDIVRGPDAALEFLPGSLQKGGGIYATTVGLGWSRDVDNGIWIYNLSYTQPWMTRFMTGKNEFMDKWLGNYQGIADRRFYYDWKLYGESDLGDYTPPAVGATVHYGYRGVPGMVHSVGFSFSAPLGVAWIRSEKTGIYDPRPDPDHKAWSAALVYGAEFIRNDYPIFLAFSLPITDSPNAPNADEYDPSPMAQWNGPDWSNVLQQWVVALGFKTSFW